MHGFTTALLVVDLQVAYFSASPLDALADRLVARTNDLTCWARAQQVPIIGIRTEHRHDRSTWTLSMLDDDAGFLLAGEPDAQNLPGLDLGGATEVVKTRDSAFFKTDLRRRLAERDVEHVILCGVSTHTCVAATAADAYAHNLRVTFAEDAIASHRPDLHEPTLNLLCEEFRFDRIGTTRLSGYDARSPR